MPLMNLLHTLLYSTVSIHNTHNTDAWDCVGKHLPLFSTMKTWSHLSTNVIHRYHDLLWLKTYVAS